VSYIPSATDFSWPPRSRCVRPQPARCRPVAVLTGYALRDFKTLVRAAQEGLSAWHARHFGVLCAFAPNFRIRAMRSLTSPVNAWYARLCLSWMIQGSNIILAESGYPQWLNACHDNSSPRMNLAPMYLPRFPFRAESKNRKRHKRNAESHREHARVGSVAHSVRCESACLYRLRCNEVNGPRCLFRAAPRKAKRILFTPAFPAVVCKGFSTPLRAARLLIRLPGAFSREDGAP